MKSYSLDIFIVVHASITVSVFKGGEQVYKEQEDGRGGWEGDGKQKGTKKSVFF